MNIKIIVIYKKYPKHSLKEDFLKMLFIDILLIIKKIVLKKIEKEVRVNQLYINMENLFLNLKMMNLIKKFLIN